LTIVNDGDEGRGHCSPDPSFGTKERKMLGEMLRQPPTADHRFDPSRRMQSTHDDLSRMFGGLRFYTAPEFPLLNLWTSPDGAILAAEVPGVAPESLDITIRRDTVTVRGTRPEESTEEGAAWLRQERMHGPFARTITLPFPVDPDKSSAKFERGIVFLTLPRPESDKPHRIKVTRA
jgi:HSP20 family protein